MAEVNRTWRRPPAARGGFPSSSVDAEATSVSPVVEESLCLYFLGGIDEAGEL